MWIVKLYRGIIQNLNGLLNFLDQLVNDNLNFNLKFKILLDYLANHKITMILAFIFQSVQIE